MYPDTSPWPAESLSWTAGRHPSGVAVCTRTEATVNGISSLQRVDVTLAQVPTVSHMKLLAFTGSVDLGVLSKTSSVVKGQLGR